MKQGTIKTLGVAAVGAAMAVGSAGAASAAPQEMPASHPAADFAQSTAEKVAELQGQDQQGQLGTAGQLLGGLPVAEKLPVAGDLAKGGVSGDAVDTDLVGGGLPVDTLPVQDLGLL
ncbi:hypothetical protein JGS22_003410 [Streptomyces sp. P38-E01]|uniref:ATP-binding protein n=1 Tax=Streptomyces tardus TaxID=2780544 RepID=A0A949JI48_9ACTN|nr:hypothetical protein [Streptomyces tardus]MBU7596709.1 hypothetical protein [Streptomyces tardus]